MVTRALFSGETGLLTHSTRIDVIGNNISNVNTTAFKASRARFEDMLLQTLEIATAPQNGRGGVDPQQVGLGVNLASIVRDTRQGSLDITGRTTDLAIQGRGFFIVNDGTNPGNSYTRDGSFSVDGTGSLVRSSDGLKVQGWNAAIDPITGQFRVDTNGVVEGVKIDPTTIMGPQATSSATFSGNLDSNASTAIDPIRVNFVKNGTTREIEIRFNRIDPSKQLFEYLAFDPSKIDPATGDFTLIKSDADGNELGGILELNSQGKVVRHFINTADGSSTTNATDFNNTKSMFLDSQDPNGGKLFNADGTPVSSLLYANNYSGTRSFNGYDFFTLSAENDGNNVASKTNNQASGTVAFTLADATTATKASTDLKLSDVPFSTKSTVGSTTTGVNFTNGFTQDGIFQIPVNGAGGAITPLVGTGALALPSGLPQGTSNNGTISNTDLAHGTRTAVDGSSALPGDGLGVPIQYIESISNEVVSKISPDRNVLQLSHNLIIHPERLNPTASGNLASGLDSSGNAVTTGGTDTSSFKIFIDGTEYTDVTNKGFSRTTAGVADVTKHEFQLDATNGVVFLDPLAGGLPNGVNAVVSYDYEIRNTVTSTNTSVDLRSVFGALRDAKVAGGATDVTVNGSGITKPGREGNIFFINGGPQSPFYRPGSGSLTILNPSNNSAAEVFTEVSFEDISSTGTPVDRNDLNSNQFYVNPTTGEIVIGTFSNGVPVDAVGGGTTTLPGASFTENWVHTNSLNGIRIGDSVAENDGGVTAIPAGTTVTNYRAATAEGNNAAVVPLGSNTFTVADDNGIVVGDVVSGVGIPAGTTVTDVNHGTSTVTISQNTTAATTAINQIFVTTSNAIQLSAAAIGTEPYYVSEDPNVPQNPGNAAGEFGYAAGAIAIAGGTTTLTAAGGGFKTAVNPNLSIAVGDTITVTSGANNNLTATVLSVDSDTQITVSGGLGADAAASFTVTPGSHGSATFSYEAYRNLGYAKQVGGVSVIVNNSNGASDLWRVKNIKDGNAENGTVSLYSEGDLFITNRASLLDGSTALKTPPPLDPTGASLIDFSVTGLNSLTANDLNGDTVVDDEARIFNAMNIQYNGGALTYSGGAVNVGPRSAVNAFTLTAAKLPDESTNGFGNTGNLTRRIETNYEVDDRVNVIIPDGLNKTPNVNVVTDLQTDGEVFSFSPNVTQITGNAGNNNQATSGDSVAAALKSGDQFQYKTGVEVFDSLGTSHNVSLTFERISQNTWAVSAPDPTDTNTPPRLAFYKLLGFDKDGKFNSATTLPFISDAAKASSDTTVTNFTGLFFDPSQDGGAGNPAKGASALQVIPDFTGLRQTAVSSDAIVKDQNGFPPGQLTNFSFNAQGFVVGQFNNGRSQNIARVAMQLFTNDAGLLSVGKNLYEDTVNSGKIGIAVPPGFDGGGTISPGALERSNVQLSTEFVDLIITQRGFQAQSRIITAADRLLQEVLGLVR